jgi:cobalt-zinc-cadmium efflux system protein
MAHYRKPLAAAVALNTGIFVVEAIAGLQSHSLSLLMDSIHNFSDELALVFLFLAFILSQGVSRNLVRTANLFNSVGLIAVSALLIWQAINRLLHPETVLGLVPVVVGLGAAVANWGVARLLRKPSRDNAAIRLAYIHNLGDVWVSLAPVVAGALIAVTGFSFFDPLVALLIALWVIVSTVREVVGSREELIWPEKIVCGHSDEAEAELPAAQP